MKVLILAAGKGKRLRDGEGDNTPKVMKCACGRPLIDYVLEALDFVAPSDITVIVGFGREQLESHLVGRYGIAVQQEQLGTGHAARCGMDSLPADYDGSVLITAGDMPLVSRETYLALCLEHTRSGADCTVLTAVAADPTGYGRILRDEKGGFAGIVEQRDCTPQQAEIKEINSSVYVFSASVLREKLGLIGRENAQGEYYLTDVPCMLARQGRKVATYRLPDDGELIGVNTREQLEQVERMLKEREDER